MADVAIELTGTLTLDSLRKAATDLLADIDTSSFGDVNGLYGLLQRRGSLVLRDATLTLPLNGERVFVGVHSLTLINTRIYVCSSELLVLCNEYKSENSTLCSFPADLIAAGEGANGDLAGKAGNNGADGLDAGALRFFITDKISSLRTIQILLDGQRGGRGGSGAAGAKGNQGGNGRNCANGTLDCKAGCGDGKQGQAGHTGGDAGYGGNGGDGGLAEFWLHGNVATPERFFSFSAQGGAGGYAGVPGFGGEGGEGGRAGRSGCSQCHSSCRNGPQGPHGAPGKAGAEGTRGVDQFLKRSTFDVEYLKAVLHSLGIGPVGRAEPELRFEMSTGVSDGHRR